MKPLQKQTQPEVAESIEILKQSGRGKLLNERLAWEPPQPWRKAVSKTLKRT